MLLLDHFEEVDQGLEVDYDLCERFQVVGQGSSTLYRLPQNRESKVHKSYA